MLVERSLAGWQEFELEVMADAAGNCVVVCSIENLDPMGVHTGDSWTVAPQQTLPDAEYQRLREAAFACARAVGVATGGANVQFAYEPGTRELVLIEMNPRVSRSSALASKATGFPIAKLAALLAVGYTLDELPNDITGKTTAAFEPALDYVAVKAPRFDFAKFPGARRCSARRCAPIGEALGLGRTFPEAFLKALEGREDAHASCRRRAGPGAAPLLRARSSTAGSIRRGGAGDRAASRATAATSPRRSASGCRTRAIADVLGVDEARCAPRRPLPGRLAVDSCAAEFEARTPYYYLSYEPSRRAAPAADRAARSSIVGSGPNRIGQGIEFDYCCVHAAQAFRKLGYEAVLLNSNPETVSTDYDTSDRLYLEPVTLERALDVCALEQPLGVVVTLGGPDAAAARARAGRGRACRCSATRSPAIDAAEDRGRFARAARRARDCARRAGAWPPTREEALAVAEQIGYPVLVRPHYVLGGRGMRVVRRAEELDIHEPSLVDEFLEGALELDVDVLCDGEGAWVAGILEHVEPAGVHSGDSACVIPAPSVTPALAAEIRAARRRRSRRRLARPRARSTSSWPSKDGELVRARGEPARVADGAVRREGDRHAARRPRLPAAARRDRWPSSTCPSGPCRRRAWAKEAIFPADRFPGAANRGPEMRSTGEVMAGGATVSRGVRARAARRRPLQAARPRRPAAAGCVSRR